MYYPRPRGHVYFASYLARTVRHCTFKLSLAAVRNLHLTSAHSDSPVTPQVLSAIRPVLQSSLSPQDFSVIWAAFNLTFFAFVRCSEFTYNSVRKFRRLFDLSTNCIAFHPTLACTQRMTVQLKSSKTNVYRRGQSLAITRTSSSLCAVSAMREYFLLAQPQEGPLFYSQSGSFLTLGAVSHLLRDSSRAAGLRYQCLKGHSVRISGASVAADAGLPDSLIKVMGCWSSDCYQVYIRIPQSILESVAPRMATIVELFSPN